MNTSMIKLGMSRVAPILGYLAITLLICLLTVKTGYCTDILAGADTALKEQVGDGSIFQKIMYIAAVLVPAVLAISGKMPWAAALGTIAVAVISIYVFDASILKG